MECILWIQTCNGTFFFLNWSSTYFEVLCHIFYIQQFGPFPAIFIYDASLYDELEVINIEPEKIVIDKGQKTVFSLDWSWVTRSQADLASAPYFNNCSKTVTQQIQPTSGNPTLNFNFVKVIAAKSWKQEFILET